MAQNSWELLPADHCAKIIVAFCSQSSGGEVYHITNPNTATPYRDLLDPARWRKAKVTISTVPHTEWFTKISKLTPSMSGRRELPPCIITETIREGCQSQLPGVRGAKLVDHRLTQFASTIPNPADSVHLAVRFLNPDTKSSEDSQPSKLLPVATGTDQKQQKSSRSRWRKSDPQEEGQVLQDATPTAAKGDLSECNECTTDGALP